MQPVEVTLQQFRSMLNFIPHNSRFYLRISSEDCVLEIRPARDVFGVYATLSSLADSGLIVDGKRLRPSDLLVELLTPEEVEQ
jgi:hypothetical protein